MLNCPQGGKGKVLQCSFDFWGHLVATYKKYMILPLTKIHDTTAKKIHILTPLQTLITQLFSNTEKSQRWQMKGIAM